jgi:tetratricopeptide (TPR) repeat protein
MELGRVFISSAFKDMFDLRDAAAEAVRLAGLEPVSTEHHVAQHGPVRDALERDIRLCDTYVGIFDRRRGTVPPGDVHAITEQELILARELGLRRLVFLSEVKRSKRDLGLNEFLDAEVTAYSSGVWSRYFEDKDALLREIVAGISSVRPRVVLEIASGAARLFLHGVAPAWTGAAVLGPEPVTLDLSPAARSVLDVFRRGAEDRGRLKEEAIHLLGQELGAAALPGRFGEALGEVLDLAASVGRLVTLEVRTADASAMALPWEMIGVPRHPLPVRSGLVEVVRRIGESGDPAHDPAPTVPDPHLSILGFTAAPLEDEAVTVRLGAGGGFASSELFWEKEQDRILIALEGLLRDRRGQLILPDTGEKKELRKYLSQADRPRVVHISCHGGVLNEKDAAPRPVLFLEDDEGHRAPLGAEELLSWSRSAPGTAKELALLVLAACSTAGTAGDRSPAPGHRVAVAESLQAGEATGLAERLVSQGFLRVLGMQSTVSDKGATAFAEKLYARLADGADLSQALRAGRAELLSLGLPHEWAVPTLTTRCDAGPLVAPKGSAAPVKHVFESVRSSFDVAGVSYLEEGYVGRREAERRLRRAFESERLIAVHGLGGIGKSTLVARFLERRQAEDWRILILYAGRELAPVTVFEEVAAKLGLARPADVSPDQAEELLRQGIRQALRAGRTALFLDNFEDNQDADGQLKDPTLGEALLDLAILGGERFRVLFTSRLPVELGDVPIEVRNLDLGELSPSGCRKLRMLDPDGLGKLSPDAWERVLSHLGGHPKALELLDGYLRGRPDRVDQLLADLGPALDAVDARLRSEIQEKGRKLLVQNVLETVPPERRPAFERLCLLEAPLPTDELEALLDAEGIPTPAADLGWLRDHGLLARTVAPSALTGGDAVHRLLASRQREALAEREGPEAVRAWHLRVAEHLVQPGNPLSNYGLAARHRDAAGNRAGALETYGRWALSLRNRHAYAASLQIAEEGLQRHPAGKSEAEKVGAANLWVRKHDALEPLGRIEEAESTLETAFGLVSEGTSQEAKFLQAAIQMLQGRLLQQEGSVQKAIEKLEAAQRGFEQGGHLRERAVALGSVAQLRAQGGDVAGALKLHEEELKTYESLGDVQSRAVTLSDVAWLRAQAGDVAGALKLHEEMLQIFESLGDVRSRAVTLGDVAQLRAQAGDVAGALKLHEEKLQICRQLGDISEVANAQYYLAGLDHEQGNTSRALDRLAESWEINLRIGRADAIAFVGQFYGQLLAPTDRPRALEILRRSRDAFELLGMTAKVAGMDQVIRRIENPEPAAEEPRPTLWQRLKRKLTR